MHRNKQLDQNRWWYPINQMVDPRDEVHVLHTGCVCENHPDQLERFTPIPVTD